MKTQNDTLQRFLLANGKARGEFIRLDDSYKTISERHPYPESVKRLLGEALAATALISATLKFASSLILQIQSKGPITLLVAQCDHQLQVRGLAQWQGEVPLHTFEHAFGEGQLALTVTPQYGERYQGIVALTSGNLAASLETYFQQSEQLPTFLFLTVKEETVVGLLLQAMPDSDQDYWQHINQLARTMTAQELVQLSNQEIIHRLFHEEDVELFAAQPVRFYCGCTRERMESAIRLMTHQEALDLLKTHKNIVVTCEFCNNHFAFDAADITKIFKN